MNNRGYTMKTVIAAIALICLASPALAISRYNSLEKTCASVQQTIQSEKAVLFRYPSTRGNLILYDRYVAGTEQCDFDFHAVQTTIPTRDNPSCPVRNCRPTSNNTPR